jgi:hypothetical protein
MHLEGKGKSANTLDGVKRHILQITKRATALFFQAATKKGLVLILNMNTKVDITVQNFLKSPINAKYVLACMLSLISC